MMSARESEIGHAKLEKSRERLKTAAMENGQHTKFWAVMRPVEVGDYRFVAVAVCMVV